MSPEQTVLVMTRGEIAGLPSQVQEEVSRKAAELRDWLKSSDDPTSSQIAFALVGAELAAEDSQ
jgi:hypothetical protein